MRNKMKKFKLMIVLMSLVLAGLIVVNGCKKSEPSPPSEPTPPSAKSEAVSAAAIEQTVCPMMGTPINKAIFTEYKGKKVYFCCPSCKPEFEKDPEKYIAKLPQFKQ